MKKYLRITALSIISASILGLSGCALPPLSEKLPADELATYEKVYDSYDSKKSEAWNLMKIAALNNIKKFQDADLPDDIAAGIKKRKFYGWAANWSLCTLVFC